MIHDRQSSVESLLQHSRSSIYKRKTLSLRKYPREEAYTHFCLYLCVFFFFFFIIASAFQFINFLLSSTSFPMQPMEIEEMEEEVNKNENWMKNFENDTLWDLVLPGTHNSCTYQTTYMYPLIINLVQTQNLSIYQQLEDGVRALDIRVSEFMEDGETSYSYWCSHTAPCQSLEGVLLQVKEFIELHPSELVVLRVKADYDVDQFWGDGEIQTIDLDSWSKEYALKEYIKGIFGVEKIITSVDKDTKILDLTSAGQQVLVIINYQGYQFTMNPFDEVTSWDTTTSSDPSTVDSNCRIWNTALDDKNSDEYRFMEHQITPDSDSFDGYIDSFGMLIGVNDILEKSYESNKLMNTWINEQDSCFIQDKVNVILFDYANKGNIEDIISLNYKCVSNSQ